MSEPCLEKATKILMGWVSGWLMLLLQADKSGPVEIVITHFKINVLPLFADLIASTSMQMFKLET